MQCSFFYKEGIFNIIKPQVNSIGMFNRALQITILVVYSLEDTFSGSKKILEKYVSKHALLLKNVIIFYYIFYRIKIRPKKNMI